MMGSAGGAPWSKQKIREAAWFFGPGPRRLPTNGVFTDSG